MAVGAAIVTAALTGTGTDRADVMLTGLLTGAAVGGAQSAVARARPARRGGLDRGHGRGLVLGWLDDLGAWIVAIERGHHIFGSSGVAAGDNPHRAGAAVRCSPRRAMSRWSLGRSSAA